MNSQQQFFPTFGADISMQGIEWYEDFDYNGSGNFDSSDIDYWNSIGRIDIVQMILGFINGTILFVILFNLLLMGFNLGKINSIALTLLIKNKTKNINKRIEKNINKYLNMILIK